MLLEINNLKKFFPVKDGIFLSTRQYIQAVNDVSFYLKNGETLGLVGESGSGKSTIARLIMQLIKADSGEVLFQGTDLAKLSFQAMKPYRRNIQMIFQDPMESLNPRFTIQQIIREPLEINGLGSKKEQDAKVEELLDLVGLQPDSLLKFPFEFSGGQRQRIGIARALALSPELLIADEPVSALDISIQAQILNLLNDLKKELNISYLFISHDLNVIRHISDRMIVLYLGKLVESAPSDELYHSPRHPYTQGLIRSIPQPNPFETKEFEAVQGEIPSPINPPSGCYFHPRCPYAEELCREKQPELITLENSERQVACHFHEKIAK